MTEFIPAESSEQPTGLSRETAALIESLRMTGAAQFDPARMHYIEALARRAGAQRENVRRLLEPKLAQAMAVLKERFERARHEAGEAAAHSMQRYPLAAGDVQQHLQGRDFRGVHRLAATLKSREEVALLTALVRQLEQQAEQHSMQDAATHPDAQARAKNEVHNQASAGARTELKTIRKFRKTWAKLSVDIQVTQALEQAPKNAGPINSHMLVLRSLALMREVSPDYLNRFMSYADTLLALDQSEAEKPANPGVAKKPRAAKATKVTKAASATKAASK
jgi:hypothetical protein